MPIGCTPRSHRAVKREKIANPGVPPSGKLVLSVVILALLACLTNGAGTARAQGNIYGTVINSNGGAPAATELTWWGFLDDTDEEIRTETNVGAGYDGGYWFDEFQNYTTEAAGNPYDYFYANSANGEAFHLEGLIPGNSFQQEDVVLTTASLPARPEGLSAEILSATQVRLSWDGVPGISYHIYRRSSDNNGVFRRLDDPSGLLANPGISAAEFIDDVEIGAAGYTYVIIGEDAAGEYSPHSTELTVNGGSLCDCGMAGDLNCDGLLQPIDVVYIVNFVFRQWPLACVKPECPYHVCDMNCDELVGPLYVIYLVGAVYRSWCSPLDRCNPQPCETF